MLKYLVTVALLAYGIVVQQALSGTASQGPHFSNNDNTFLQLYAETYLHMDPSDPAQFYTEGDIARHYKQVQQVAAAVYPLAVAVSAWTSTPFALEPRQVKRWLHRSATDREAATVHTAAVLLTLHSIVDKRLRDIGETGISKLEEASAQRTASSINSSARDVEQAVEHAVSPEEVGHAATASTLDADRRSVIGQGLKPLLRALREANTQLSQLNSLEDALVHNEQVKNAAKDLLLCCYSQEQLAQLLVALGAAVDILDSSRSALIAHDWYAPGTIDAHHASAEATSTPTAQTDYSRPLLGLPRPLASGQQLPSTALGRSLNSSGNSPAGQQSSGAHDLQPTQHLAAPPAPSAALALAHQLQHARSLHALQHAPSVYASVVLPDGFRPKDHSQQPKLLIPLVFHVLTYRVGYNGEEIGPAQYTESSAMIQRLVAITNRMATQANIEFALLTVRNDPRQHSYLLLPSRAVWLHCLILPSSRGGSMPSPACPIYSSTAFTRTNVVAFPRAINIFVSGDSSSNGGVVGYAYRPGNPSYPAYGHVGVSWDTVWTSFLNSADLFEEGAGILWHELAHHLGLQHPFGSRTIGCGADDALSDTPRTAGPVYAQPWAGQAQEYCYGLFYNKFGGGASAWRSIYARWARPAGIPAEDASQHWADSCASQPGLDELGNYLTYSFGVCIATLGHLTVQQVGWLHRVSYEEQYEMYAWAQYYASIGYVPGAELPLTLAGADMGAAMTFDPCKVSSTGCPCKANWTFNNHAQQYCSALLDPTSTASGLWCMLDLNAVDKLPGNTRCTPRYIVTSSGGAQGSAWDTCTASATLCARVSPSLASQAQAQEQARLADTALRAARGQQGGWRQSVSSPPQPPAPPPAPPLLYRQECMVSLNGCKCKALWRYEGSPSYFCAAPDGDARLWCFIENDNNCKPTAEPTDWSWDYCSPNLAPKDCVGQVTGSAADTLTHASSIRIMAMALFVVLVIMQVLQ